MVPAAVDLSLLVEVDEIDQQLHAGGALETLRVPAAAVSRPTGKHSYVSTADLSPTLETWIWVGEVEAQHITIFPLVMHYRP